MKCETVLEMLDDYVDQRLIGEEPALVERHLASCRGCAREAEALRGLLRKANGLPRDVPPRGDLWPAIRDGIERGTARRRPRVLRWGLAAAAAVVLAVLGASLLAREMPETEPGGAMTPAAPTLLSLEIRRAEAEYARARGELVAAMGRTSDRLSPDTRRVIEENLAVIDGAIREIRASLERDPENVYLFDMLVAEQDRGLRLLGLEQELAADNW